MKKRRIFRSRLLIAAILCAVCVFAVNCFIAQSKINTKQAELNRLQVEYESICALNAEKQNRLSKGADAANLEKAAREKYGYVYPDERVYVVTP
ncbi:MAG: septum formation initiator family protein [Clostridia bacterium]|nr:septum formation initiator family protein [Clostridia bacterium]